MARTNANGQADRRGSNPASRVGLKIARETR
jgi:hypothetical protein